MRGNVGCACGLDKDISRYVVGAAIRVDSKDSRVIVLESGPAGRGMRLRSIIDVFADHSGLFLERICIGRPGDVTDTKGF